MRRAVAGSTRVARLAGSHVASVAATASTVAVKWAFLFWIGQVVAIGTLFGVLLRLGRAG